MLKASRSILIAAAAFWAASGACSADTKDSAQLFAAASRGDFAQVTQILSADPSSASLTDPTGASALHYAIVSGSAQTVDALIAKKVDLNARKKDGVMPSHVAAALGNEYALKSLISAGADYTSADNRGRTPISLAKTHGHIGIVRMLRAHGVADAPKPTAYPAVSFQKKYIRNCGVNCIYINLNDPKVKISAAISQQGIGRRETWKSFLQRLKPTAAVNGTYFCNSSGIPVGDIVISGKQVNFGGMGTAMCITPDNIVRFQSTDRGRHMNWSEFETVVCAGPRLLTAGNVTINPRPEGFRDPHVLGCAKRMAVGITDTNSLLFISTSKACSLSRLAAIMKDLGCYNAMNLDGGSSIGMQYRGRTIAKPSRSLTNVLAVYEAG